MGKLQSKHACRRRENPEGDSLVINVSRKGMEECGRFGALEHKIKGGQESSYRQFLENDGLIEVALPPERPEGSRSFVHGERDAPKVSGRKCVTVDDLECDVSVEEDNRQEWIFTLYNFDNNGRVTKEDMCSLMHSIYDVVDASVNHSSSSKNRSLRVKLTVSPGPGDRKREAPSDRDSSRCRAEEDHQEEGRCVDKRLSAHFRRQNSETSPTAERNHYCVDENTERRNHYLDLAGIENYTSRFEGGGPLLQLHQEAHRRGTVSQSRSRSQESEAHMAHQRRLQVLLENCTYMETRGRGVQFLRSPKGTSRGLGGISVGGPGGSRSGRLQPASQAGLGAQDVYHLPAQTPGPPPHQQYQLQHSSSKRLRVRARDALSPSRAPYTPLQQQPAPSAIPSGPEREHPPSLPGTPGLVVPVVQRHEHQHHHEHHHHHHYHHYHQS